MKYLHVKIKFLIILFSFLSSSFLNAQTVTSEKDDLETSLFVYANDHTISESGTCQASCRAVKSGYVTQITNFNAKNGITQCSVYRANDLSKPIGFLANTLNKKCVKDTNAVIEFGKGNLKAEGANNQFTSVAKIDYNTSALTLSKFLAGFATLDPSLIDFNRTQQQGLLVLKDPSILYGRNMVGLTPNKETTLESQYVATADSFNKANMAYFSNLYANMSEVYQHLQNLLVVVVGMFFLASISFRKLTAWLDKNDAGNEKSQWLSRFYSPLLAVGFFFVPIPEDANMNTTIVQKTIRYFVQESTTLADRASAIGTQTYMRKLYSTVGAMTVTGEADVRKSVLDTYNLYSYYGNELTTKCKVRYPNVATFQLEDPKKYERFDLNSKGASITFEACQQVERDFLLNRTLYVQSSKIRDQIDKTFADNKLQGKLTVLNTALNNREAELGWIHATIIPSVSVLVESLSFMEDNSVALQLQNQNQDKIEERQKQQEQDFKDEKTFWEWIKSEAGGVGGQLIGNLAYFMLPGAGSIHDALEQFIDKVKWAVTLLISKIATPIAGAASGVLLSVGGKLLAVVATIYILKFILSHIPIVTAVVAGILAFLSYFIELLMYFYITPFVVAFSITTKNTHKIVEFLVQGISVFFKPVLIVMFIFFALFVHTLVQDVFLTYTTEQFGILGNVNTEFYIGLQLGVFEAIVGIVGTLGSIYIMWKLIVHGASWTLKMVGINNSNTDIVTSGLEQRLENRSFSM
ncbi:MAG: hypothetical protein ACK5LP_10345 [Campylobacteraceae bacterium]